MIEGIITFCKDNFKKEYQCPSCINRDCPKSCKKCLENINYSKHAERIQIGYNCLNITYYYLCNYGFKYLSEIEKLLLANAKQINRLDCINAISIGCGPCTDLFGVVNFIKSNSPEKIIKYCGIEKNKIWETIHNKIFELKPDNLKPRFLYDDLYNVKFKNVPNMVIMQYLLSDVLSFDPSLEKIYDFLIENIIKRMDSGSIILINDINLGSDYGGPRDSYQTFINKIIAAQVKIETKKYHFVNDSRNYCRYGNQHANNRLTVRIDDTVRYKFDPWRSCTSAQLYIRIL